MSREVRQVVIDWSPPWPQASNEALEHYTGAQVRSTFYPARAPWDATGNACPDNIDNLRPFPAAVVERLWSDLVALSCSHEVLKWRHAWHCPPELARRLPELPFPLRVVEYADDCRWSSPTATLPVARGFNAAVHYMHLYDIETGARARDAVYAGLDARFAALGVSSFLHEAAGTFDLGCKVERIRSGAVGDSLVFVGTRGMPGTPRHACLGEIAGCDLGGARLALHGGLRDGWLEPAQIAQLYTGALFGYNAAVSSVFNLRFFDLPAFGVVPIVHDPCGELADFGFEPEQHYLPCDGTARGLADVVRTWAARRDTLAGIVQAGAERTREFVEVFRSAAVYGRLYRDYADAIEAVRDTKDAAP